MKHYFTTSIGLLRLVGLLEGLSFLILVFVGVPLKYFLDSPALVKSCGPVHGVLFIWFIANALLVAYQKKWSFFSTTWKVLIASFIPFGTFYVDKHILSK